MLKTAILFCLLATILGIPIWNIVFKSGWGRHYHTQHPGKCSIVTAPGIGSEDFQILTSGKTFITSGAVVESETLEYNNYARSKGNGSILLLDMNNPTLGARELFIKHGVDFNSDTFAPHGLSVLEDKVKGEHLLYVINHVEGEADRVEKFRYSPKTKELQHEKSIFSDAFRYVNDLAVIEEDKFYIGNFLYFQRANMVFMENLYRPPLGGVAFYNGAVGRVMKDGIIQPNGVILSADNRFVYVAEFLDEKIAVYQRKSDYDLDLVQELTVHTAMDNFHLSENGDALYVGCHPIIHKAHSHFSDPENNKAPSQVLRLPLKDGLVVEGEITQEFYDQGDLISGSSVAGVYDNKLLIGSVIHTLVICDLPEDKRQRM